YRLLGRGALGLELRLLGRADERQRRRLAARHRLRDEVEVAGADLALVARRGVALRLERELVLLQAHVRGHPLARVALGELEHRRGDRVEARERDELEAVAGAREGLLEGGDLGVVELALPVERRRAVVREQL